MKLSTKGRYGLRAMIDLASHEEEGAVSIASISERQNISESYLEQLVRPLLNDGCLINLCPSVSLPVDLYWHCWNLDSALLNALTEAVIAEAAHSLKPAT
mgnify:CR=1 FL=1